MGSRLQPIESHVNGSLSRSFVRRIIAYNHEDFSAFSSPSVLFPFGVVGDAAKSHP